MVVEIPSLAGCKRKLKGRNRLDNRRWRSVGGAGKLEIARQPRNGERNEGENRAARKTLREKSVFTFRPESQCRILLPRNDGTKRLGQPVATAPQPASQPCDSACKCAPPFSSLHRVPSRVFHPFHNDFSNELQSLAIPEYPHRRLQGAFDSSAFFPRERKPPTKREIRVGSFLFFFFVFRESIESWRKFIALIVKIRII